jgi:putative transposase
MQSQYEELTDSQWEVIEKVLADPRVRQHSLRTMLNAILWVNRTGLQWREVNKSSYPCWQSVYYYFRKWKLSGMWEQLLDTLTLLERKQQKRKETPSLLAVDSQSVKTVAFVCLDIGIDGGKWINGRKRHLAVDTLGFPWAIVVTAANVSDTEAGCQLMDRLHGKVPRLKKIAADHGYRTTYINHVENNYGWQVEIKQKPESVRGFVPEKNRWMVERSFGWLNFRRRLAKEYEKTVESAEAMLQIAFISFLLNRIKN